MTTNKYILGKYKDIPLAKSNSPEGRSIYLDSFFDERQFLELIESLEDKSVLLTQNGVNFIKEYFGFEHFISLVDQSQGNRTPTPRSAAGIKWVLQRLKEKSGIDLEMAKKFETEESVKKSSIDKFGKEILAEGNPPFGKRFPEKYLAKDFLDPVTFMFFLDKLDSSEAQLTKVGLDFIKEEYGWEKIIQIFDLLHSSGFILRYKAPEDIVFWLKSLGKFPEPRETMLSRDGY